VDAFHTVIGTEFDRCQFSARSRHTAPRRSHPPV